MDLNGLKRCNDCFGYAAGDALICRVAAVSYTHLRAHET